MVDICLCSAERSASRYSLGTVLCDRQILSWSGLYGGLFFWRGCHCYPWSTYPFAKKKTAKQDAASFLLCLERRRHRCTRCTSCSALRLRESLKACQECFLCTESRRLQSKAAQWWSVGLRAEGQIGSSFLCSLQDQSSRSCLSSAVRQDWCSQADAASSSSSWSYGEKLPSAWASRSFKCKGMSPSPLCKLDKLPSIRPEASSEWKATAGGLLHGFRFFLCWFGLKQLEYTWKPRMLGFGVNWACSLPTAKTRKRKPFRIANGRTICPNLPWFGADAFPLD